MAERTIKLTRPIEGARCEVVHRWGRTTEYRKNETLFRCSACGLEEWRPDNLRVFARPSPPRMFTSG